MKSIKILNYPRSGSYSGEAIEIDQKKMMAIEFVLDNGMRISISMNKAEHHYSKKDCLIIRSSLPSLAITPQASNIILVDVSYD